MSADLANPVFGTVKRARGHYESYYLRAVAPDAPSAVWIRYTVHKNPGEAPKGSLWCTLFDATQPGPLAVKQTLADVKPGRWIDIGAATFGPGHAQGSAEALDHNGSWQLAFGEGSGAHLHLPKEWMYHRALPKTKTLSPVCDTTFSGFVEVDGHRLDVDGWRGMVGHNWGAEHAERWIWLHGIAFADAPDAWLDMAIGRVKVGPATTPWIANGVLHLDGQRRTLGGIGAIRDTTVSETPHTLQLSVPGLDLRVASPTEQTIGFVYADPGGDRHDVVHSSIASMTVSVDGRTLSAPHGACYELGMRERDHGVTIQPFPDG